MMTDPADALSAAFAALQAAFATHITDDQTSTARLEMPSSEKVKAKAAALAWEIAGKGSSMPSGLRHSGAYRKI
jgi:hypothetical protein